MNAMKPGAPDPRRTGHAARILSGQPFDEDARIETSVRRNTWKISSASSA